MLLQDAQHQLSQIVVVSNFQGAMAFFQSKSWLPKFPQQTITITTLRQKLYFISQMVGLVRSLICVSPSLEHISGLIPLTSHRLRTLLTCVDQILVKGNSLHSYRLLLRRNRGLMRILNWESNLGLLQTLIHFTPLMLCLH